MAEILLVEDSPTQAAMYSAYLMQAGHQVEAVTLGREAIRAMTQNLYDMMILDIQLPDMNGFDVLNSANSDAMAPPTIVLTGNGSVTTAVNAMRAGAFDFLMKPCNGEKLCEAVRAGLERVERDLSFDAEEFIETPLKNDAASKGRQGPSGFLGESSAMKNVFSLIENAAKSSASVFITGASGTGKELCAQSIHKASPRNNGPFIALNCAAIPRDLMESEIFGHRKGAFTGAVNDREGAAAMANGGTLFLDELCEMDLDLQVKLLRFIQTGTYRRVGDEHERQTDIRFVCATNRDPLVEVQEKRFREDLYYRLHVIPISMPALKERGADIALLAERFLRDFSAIEGKSFSGMEEPVKQLFYQYEWPGNVRELQNIIRRIVVMNGGGTVSLEMVPTNLKDALSSLQIGRDGAVDAEETSTDLSRLTGDDCLFDEFLVRPMEELEILAIDAAIRKYAGNVTRAAKALNISTSSIYRKKKNWQDQCREEL